ncbi:hypothetical protein [Sandaracinobacteroides sayramensis]|nr:hypothetical protein [Sandaracinobacteroides sayramensis]
MANDSDSRAKALKTGDGNGLDRLVTLVALLATLALIFFSVPA